MNPAFRTVGAACLAMLALGLAPVDDDDDGDHAAPVIERPPHSRAPAQVDVRVLEDDVLRGPLEEWFEAQVEAGNDRFEYVEELVDIDGDFEPGYRDSEGVYFLAYDEEEDELAYWQNVSAEQLTRGRSNFIQFCASCHGLQGDGYGRSAQHLRPPPRSFHQSSFKFTKVPVGQLPTDDALITLVKRGLDGTPMYPWALSDKQLDDIIQYIKSLSPPDEGWRDIYAEVEGKVDLGEDPWVGNEDEAIAAGETVYHNIGCYGCHPGYLTPAAIDDVLVSEGKQALGSYREDLTYPKIVADSTYEVLGYGVSILPPDFTWHEVRAGRDDDGNLSAYELAMTVGAGIGGAGMPQWKGSIPDEDIWAIGYYVKHLIETYKDDPAARTQLMNELRADD